MASRIHGRLAHMRDAYGAVLAVAAAGLLISTGVWMVRAWSPLPFWDQWESIFEYMLLSDQGPRLSQLVGQHNEHRLVFPRLFFLADIALFGAANRLLFPMLIAIQLGHAAMLVGFGRPAPTDWKTFAPVAAAVVALMVSLTQAENLFWGFQIQFVGVFACVSGAYFLLARAVSAAQRGAAGLGYLAGGLVLLGVAIFTMANGVVAALIAVMLMAVLRAPLRMLAAVVLTVAVCAAVFFHGYVRPAHDDLGVLISSPLRALHYVALFLGNIAAPLWQDGGAARRALFGPVLLGAAGIILAGAATLRAPFEARRDPIRAALTAVMLFAAASAVLTAVGRIGMGLESAFTTRYGTVSAVFWAAQLLYWNRVATAGPPRWRGAMAAASGGMIVLLIAVQVRIEPVMTDHIRRVRLATDALLTGVDDSEAMVGVFSRPGDVAGRADFLKAKHLSVFATPQAAWIGRPVGAVIEVTSGALCRGSVDAVVQAPEAQSGAVRAMGWAWDKEHARLPRHIVLADPRGRVAGMASTGFSRPDVADASGERRMLNSGWRGYAALRDGDRVAGYAMLDGRRGCPLAGDVTARLQQAVKLDPIERRKLGPAFDLTPALSGTFEAAGFHPSAGIQPEAAFGSGRRSDGDQGAVEFGPFTSQGAHIGIGMVTGPNTGDQSIEIRDAASGEVLSRFSPKVRSQWTYLAVPAPAGRAVKLIVRDGGSGWGQWIAVTRPHPVLSE